MALSACPCVIVSLDTSSFFERNAAPCVLIVPKRARPPAVGPRARAPGRMGNSPGRPDRTGAIPINHVSCERIESREGRSGRMNRGKHVAVLMGGWSAEREVSLRSGKACADVLEKQDYRLTRIDVGRDIATVLQTLKPEVALNLLHGRPGEDGTVQGILEIIGVPYTHSRVLASALAIQKDLAKAVLRGAAIAVPDGMVVSRFEAVKSHVLPRPYVIKPLAEGSSVGVFIVTEDHEHPTQELHRDDWPF